MAIEFRLAVLMAEKMKLKDLAETLNITKPMPLTSRQEKSRL